MDFPATEGLLRAGDGSDFAGGYHGSRARAGQFQRDVRDVPVHRRHRPGLHGGGASAGEEESPREAHRRRLSGHAAGARAPAPALSPGRHHVPDRGRIRRFPAASAGERGGLCFPAGPVRSPDAGRAGPGVHHRRLGRGTGASLRRHPDPARRRFGNGPGLL